MGSTSEIKVKKRSSALDGRASLIPSGMDLATSSKLTKANENSPFAGELALAA